jgi:hypothetical protein
MGVGSSYQFFECLSKCSSLQWAMCKKKVLLLSSKNMRILQH